MSREKAIVDLWLEGTAPFAGLRPRYGLKAGRWPELRRRYFAELDTKLEVVAELRGRGRATLVYATHDAAHSNAQALLEYLER